jgi:hypothetical protein
MANATKRIDIGLFAQDRQLQETIQKAKADFDVLRERAKNIALTADDRDLQLKAKAAVLTLDKLNRTVARPNVKLEGVDSAILKAETLDLALSKTSKETLPLAASGVTTLGKDLGSLSGMAMPAAIGGLVALSGQASVLAFGLGGLGLAALPVIRNHQLLAKVTAPLSSEFNAFSKSLQPEVLSAFGKAAGIASHILKDIQPISKESGKALSGVLGQIDAEFQSGTWQKFFGFMEQNAGPDIRQLGGLFTDLLDVLPQVAMDLHPIGSALITITDDATKALGPLGKVGALAVRSNQAQFHAIKSADNWVTNLTNHIPGARAINDSITADQQALGLGSKAATGQNSLALAAQKAALAAQAEQRSMAQLSTSIGDVINKTLTLQGSDVAWKQAQQSATQAVNANKNSLDKNSSSALAAKAALIQSSQAALAAAQSQVTMNHNTSAASRIINAQIAYLQQHAAHSRFAASEVLALMQAEARLPRNVQSKITVNTTTAAYAIAGIRRQLSLLDGKVVTTYVSTVFRAPTGSAQGNVRRGFAAGTPSAPSGWSWVGEQGPELVKMKGGERVIPSHVSLSLADVPGFASGTNYTIPSPASVSAAPQKLQIEWIGSNADSELMTFIAKNIRVRGGDPSVLSRKVKFA